MEKQIIKPPEEGKIEPLMSIREIQDSIDQMQDLLEAVKNLQTLSPEAQQQKTEQILDLIIDLGLELSRRSQQNQIILALEGELCPAK
jgi:uncharacterized membrane protein